MAGDRARRRARRRRSRSREKYAAFARRLPQRAVYETIRLEQQFVAGLKGLTRGPTSFDDAAFDEAPCARRDHAARRSRRGIVFYHIMKLIARVHLRADAEALAAARSEAQTVLRAAMAHAHRGDPPLLLRAHAGGAPPAARRRRAAGSDPRDSSTHDAEARALGGRAAPRTSCTAHALVSAEIARIDGRRARRRAPLRAGHPLGARQRLRPRRGARLRARRRGSTGREGFEPIADTLPARGPRLLRALGRRRQGQAARSAHPQPPRAEAARARPPPSRSRPEQLDLLSVTKASQTISGEIVLDKLLRTLLAGRARAGRRAEGLPHPVSGREPLDRGGGRRSRTTGAVDEPPRSAAGGLARSASPSRSSTTCSAPRSASSSTTPPPMPASSPATTYFARHRPQIGPLPAHPAAGRGGRPALPREQPPRRRVHARSARRPRAARHAGGDLPGERAAARQGAGGAGRGRGRRSGARPSSPRPARSSSESLDYEETLRAPRRGCACARSADWCVIDIVEGREIRRLAGRTRDPAKEPLLEELQRRYPPRWDSPHPAATVLRTGEPLLLPELSDEVLRRTAEDERALRGSSARSGRRARIAVPLVARGQTLGALSLVSSAPGRRYGRADLELVPGGGAPRRDRDRQRAALPRRPGGRPRRGRVPHRRVARAQHADDLAHARARRPCSGPSRRGGPSIRRPWAG